MLPKGNQGQVLINETDCAVELDGRQFSGQGAFVDQKIAVVYIKIKKPMIQGLGLAGPIEIIATDWHGQTLGPGVITALWHQTNYREKYKMASVVFQIEGLWYKGRFAPDHGDLCRGTRLRTKKVIAELTARLKA